MQFLAKILQKQSNSEITKVIIKLGQLFLIIPSYLKIDERPCQVYLIYFLAFASILSLNVLSLRSRWNTTAQIASLSTVLDTLSTVCTLNVVIWFCRSGFRNRNLFNIFINNFENDELANSTKPKRRIYGRITIVAGYIMLFYVFDCYAWMQIESFQGYATYIVEKLGYIHTHCCLLLYCEIVKLIELRFDKIISNLNGILVLNRKNIDEKFLETSKVRIRKSIQDYIVATKQVDLFNKLYGMGIFFYYIDVLMGFVLSLNSGFILLNEDVENEDDAKVKCMVIGLYFSFAFMELLTGIKLVIACRGVALKSAETGDLVYETMQEFSVTRGYGMAVGIRQDMVIFCKQTMDVQLYFSAAGFFRIDTSLLTDIINSVITYLVMLAQLNKTLNNYDCVLI